MSENLSIRKIYGGTGLISEKTEALYVELNEKTGAATSIYPAPDNFSQYNYSVLVTNNKKKIRSRCLVHEISFTDIFNDINYHFKCYHGKILNKRLL